MEGRRRLEKSPRKVGFWGSKGHCEGRFAVKELRSDEN